ncbi:glycoside hydrolase family 18 protein [Rhodocollybia butyracea]|uniref:Glycoside hydrolase family 18 protein n=1 Tax=Rhodocollybia butyracea TaxID=206335 RepID=A0A9P5Q493_9AGAR|nr:glycoside hydrolase family 18 protein [Rhodocollybia butyracea]
MSTVIINTHTTASSPRPHILYTVQVTHGGEHLAVNKRYSEFVTLHHTLQPGKEINVSLPPKRILATSFLPSAWLDDTLIEERKNGLAAYLTAVLSHPTFRDTPALNNFLSLKTSDSQADRTIDLEDALPSTLSRGTALKLAAQLLPQNGKTNGQARAESTLIAAAYYPDWSEAEFPPESLDYTRFTILFFAFAVPNSSNTLTWDSGSQDMLTRTVTAAQNSGAGTRVVLSVGGWGGSVYFSQCVSTAANRTTFVNTLVSAVDTFGLDGIDIDWEYPNQVGAGNINSPSDAANLLLFLTQLRSALGTSKIISAAVPDVPWLGSNGDPLTNVSAYAAQMTYLNLMNYDVFQSSSTPGPNAPLSDACGTASLPQYSAQAALSQWTSAGFPASKILLGLPLYGYVSNSSATALQGSFVDPSNDIKNSNGGTGGARGPVTKPGGHARTKRSAIPTKTTQGGQPDGMQMKGGKTSGGIRAGKQKAIDALAQNETDVAETANLQSWYGQQIPFGSIVASGALVKNSDGTYGGGGGFTEGWDNCSDTPYLFNTSQATVVTYDDTFSLGDKATFAAQNGMAGCFTWSLDQDDGVTLQNVIRSSLGLS